MHWKPKTYLCWWFCIYCAGYFNFNSNICMNPCLFSLNIRLIYKYRLLSVFLVFSNRNIYSRSIMYLDSNDHSKTVAAFLESLCKRKKNIAMKRHLWNTDCHFDPIEFWQMTDNQRYWFTWINHYEEIEFMNRLLQKNVLFC